MRECDVAVIGAGPGGYMCAELLAKQGKSVCLIEKRAIGGTCLNEGCVPAKNFLECAQLHYKAKLTDFKMPLLCMETNTLIETLRKGIETKLSKAGVEILKGEASFEDPYTLHVKGETSLHVKAKNIIIATGSSHRPHPLLSIDKKHILSSREVFALQEVPKRILVVGGGAIGCEFATFFHALGSETVIAEFTPQLIPAEDGDVAEALMREFKKKKIKVHLSANITAYEVTAEGIDVTMETPKGEVKMQTDLILVSIGRMPNTAALALDKAGVESARGFVTVNKRLQTSQPHIYAIGDVIMTPALAHTAYNEALTVAKNMVGGDVTSAFVIPYVTFCQPQIGSAGKNEKTLNAEGVEFEVKKHFFKSSCKAKIKGDDSGFIKLMVDPVSDTILGACIIGNDATELIHQLIIAINAKVTTKELSEMVFAHPTLSESLWEMVQ